MQITDEPTQSYAYNAFFDNGALNIVSFPREIDINLDSNAFLRENDIDRHS